MREGTVCYCVFCLFCCFLGYKQSFSNNGWITRSYLASSRTIPLQYLTCVFSQSGLVTRECWDYWLHLCEPCRAEIRLRLSQDILAHISDSSSTLSVCHNRGIFCQILANITLNSWLWPLQKIKTQMEISFKSFHVSVFQPDFGGWFKQSSVNLVPNVSKVFLDKTLNLKHL